MREIDSSVIRDTVCALTIKADYILPDEVLGLIKNEADGTLPGTLCGSIAENAVISAEGKYPICQDTGMVTVYAEIGQDVHINGSFTDAVNAGVRDASEKGYLRRSVVADPFDRVNTGDNTPAVIYTDLVGGDGIHLTVLPKGFGSENKCAVRMLNPSDGVDGAVEFAVSAAGLLSAAPLTGVRCFRKKRCLCRSTSRRSLKNESWTESTPAEAEFREWAAKPRCGLTLYGILPISQVSRLRSASAVTPAGMPKQQSEIIDMAVSLWYNIHKGITNTERSIFNESKNHRQKVHR